MITVVYSGSELEKLILDIDSEARDVIPQRYNHLYHDITMKYRTFEKLSYIEGNHSKALMNRLRIQWGSFFSHSDHVYIGIIFMEILKQMFDMLLEDDAIINNLKLAAQ